jgi:hypothetical protein
MDPLNIIIPKVWPWDHNTIGEGLSFLKGGNTYLLDFNSIANILIKFVSFFNQGNNEV